MISVLLFPCFPSHPVVTGVLTLMEVSAMTDEQVSGFITIHFPCVCGSVIPVIGREVSGPQIVYVRDHKTPKGEKCESYGSYEIPGIGVDRSITGEYSVFSEGSDQRYFSDLPGLFKRKKLSEIVNHPFIPKGLSQNNLDNFKSYLNSAPISTLLVMYREIRKASLALYNVVSIPWGDSAEPENFAQIEEMQKAFEIELDERFKKGVQSLCVEGGDIWFGDPKSEDILIFSIDSAKVLPARQVPFTPDSVKKIDNESLRVVGDDEAD